MTDGTEDRRITAALENIAEQLHGVRVAVEQMALERAVKGAAPVFGFVNSDPNRPLDQEPPLPTPPPNLPVTPIMAPLPPVVAAPFQFTGPSAQCPVHHVAWKTVPAGTSKRTEQAYSAFLACPTMDCKARPG